RLFSSPIVGSRRKRRDWCGAHPAQSCGHARWRLTRFSRAKMCRACETKHPRRWRKSGRAENFVLNRNKSCRMSVEETWRHQSLSNQSSKEGMTHHDHSHPRCARSFGCCPLAWPRARTGRPRPGQDEQGRRHEEGLDVERLDVQGFHVQGRHEERRQHDEEELIRFECRCRLAQKASLLCFRSVAESCRLLLLAADLAGGVTRVALGLLFSLDGSGASRLLFLLAREAQGFVGGGFFCAPLLLGLFGLARQPCLFSVGRNRFALGATRRDCRIVQTGLSTEFVQEILLRLLCRFLPVGEAWFSKATHRSEPCTFRLLHYLLEGATAEHAFTCSGAMYSVARPEATQIPVYLP